MANYYKLQTSPKRRTYVEMAELVAATHQRYFVKGEGLPGGTSVIGKYDNVDAVFQSVTNICLERIWCDSIHAGNHKSSLLRLLFFKDALATQDFVNPESPVNPVTYPRHLAVGMVDKLIEHVRLIRTIESLPDDHPLSKFPARHLFRLFIDQNKLNRDQADPAANLDQIDAGALLFDIEEPGYMASLMFAFRTALEAFIQKEDFRFDADTYEALRDACVSLAHAKDNAFTRGYRDNSTASFALDAKKGEIDQDGLAEALARRALGPGAPWYELAYGRHTAADQIQAINGSTVSLANGTSVQFGAIDKISFRCRAATAAECRTRVNAVFQALYAVLDNQQSTVLAKKTAIVTCARTLLQDHYFPDGNGRVVVNVLLPILALVHLHENATIPSAPNGYSGLSVPRLIELFNEDQEFFGTFNATNTGSGIPARYGRRQRLEYQTAQGTYV